MSICPTYSATHKSIAKATRTVSRRFPVPPNCLSGAFKRFASTSTPASSPQKAENESTSIPEPLTLLHKTRKLLPRVLGNARPGFQRSVETDQNWDSILSRAYDDLSAATERPARILVCGLDEWSGAQDLVTALLADPLSSDATQNDALNDRWSDSNSQRTEIIHSVDGISTPTSFKSSSSYLTQFNVPMQITEIRSPPSSSSSGFHQSREALQGLINNPAIFDADIPILVCNPITTSLETIFEAQLPTNTILILTSSIPQADLDALIQQRLSHSSTSHSQLKHIRVISADPGRAIQAVEALQAQPNSLSAIQKYQIDFVGSQLSKVTNGLRQMLAPEGLNTTRKKLGLSHIQDVLCWSLANVRRVRNELDRAFIDQTTLKETIEEHRAKVVRDVFGGHGESDKDSLDAVAEAIKQAEQDIRPVMDRLTWWKMIWRVDEISSIVNAAVARSWCYNLEKKLILHTGRLSVLQDEVYTSAFDLVSKHPTVSTAVLKNKLLQIKRSPGYTLTADSLIQPIYSRRNQINDYPTMRLHVTGQRAVLCMTGGILGGAGIGWAGWLGWLLGSGEGLLGFVGMEAGTAMGVGMLTAAASVRWAVGRWEKSKKRWWQDWARVGEGLDRDLKAKLQETMQQKVVVMGETACEAMSQSICAREEEIVTVAAELEEVKRGLDSINYRVGQKS